MYKVVKENGVFHVRSEQEPVFTPAGNPVTTVNEALAVKLAEHFEQHGVNAENKNSIAYFHCSMLDFIQNYPRTSIEHQLLLGFDPFNDWTLRCRTSLPEVQQRRKKVFGEPQVRMQEGKAWIETLSLYQLCAVMVLGKAMKSLNIAYLAVKCADHAHLTTLIKHITLFNPKFGQDSPEQLLENYLFYFRL